MSRRLTFIEQYSGSVGTVRHSRIPIVNTLWTWSFLDMCVCVCVRVFYGYYSCLRMRSFLNNAHCVSLEDIDYSKIILLSFG
jgi:hypothetical protein